MYTATTTWLEDNGGLFVEPNDHVFGEINGVPIMHYGARLQFEANGSAVRRVAPHAARLLGVGAALGFVYCLPNWGYHDNGRHIYDPPSCQFEIEKDADSPNEQERCLLRVMAGSLILGVAATLRPEGCLVSGKSQGLLSVT